MNKKEAHDFVQRLAEGISSTFGNNCETVIHEITRHEMKIVHINNSHVTGRNIGDTRNILGDKAVIKEIYEGKDLYNYKARTKDGRMVKSTTIHCKGEGYHYSIGINFDYTYLAHANSILSELVSTGPEYDNVLTNNDEISIHDIFNEYMERNNVPVSMMTKQDKLNLVKILESRNAFTIRGSVPAISDKLGVSRYTVYNYLKEIRNKN